MKRRNKKFTDFFRNRSFFLDGIDRSQQKLSKNSLFCHGPSKLNRHLIDFLYVLFTSLSRPFYVLILCYFLVVFSPDFGGPIYFVLLIRRKSTLN